MNVEGLKGMFGHTTMFFFNFSNLHLMLSILIVLEMMVKSGEG